MTTNDNHLAILQKWKWQLSPPLATRWPFTDRDQNGCCTNHWSLGHSCQWSFYSLGAWNGFCAWRKWRILSCLFKIGWLQNQRFSGMLFKIYYLAWTCMVLTGATSHGQRDDKWDCQVGSECSGCNMSCLRRCYYEVFKAISEYDSLG
jgi:hypothetical protein